jgi:hypothetical protein
MTGVSTVRNIYEGLQSRRGEPTLVNLLRRRSAMFSRPPVCLDPSAMLPRPPALLDPGQGDVGRNGTAPVEDALRSVRREFDTRPVSMDLRHPAAIDGPEKSGASAARPIAAAAEQGPSIPA